MPRIVLALVLAMMLGGCGIVEVLETFEYNIACQAVIDELRRQVPKPEEVTFAPCSEAEVKGASGEIGSYIVTGYFERGSRRYKFEGTTWRSHTGEGWTVLLNYRRTNAWEGN